MNDFQIISQGLTEATGTLNEFKWSIAKQDDETFEVTVSKEGFEDEFHEGHESMTEALEYVGEGGF